MVVERARNLLEYLLINDVPPPKVIPAGSGSILLEWSTDLVHLEIDIDPIGEDSIFIEKENRIRIEYIGSFFEIDDFHRKELNSALNRLMV